jgi:hypothetical protein
MSGRSSVYGRWPGLEGLGKGSPRTAGRFALAPSSEASCYYATCYNMGERGGTKEKMVTNSCMLYGQNGLKEAGKLLFSLVSVHAHPKRPIGCDAAHTAFQVAPQRQDQGPGPGPGTRRLVTRTRGGEETAPQEQHTHTVRAFSSSTARPASGATQENPFRWPV